MLNQEMRTVTMSRSDMFRVRQALTCVVLDFRREIADPETTEDRRQIAKSSLAMWGAHPFRVYCPAGRAGPRRVPPQVTIPPAPEVTRAERICV